ncbi:hypothetical protein A0H76_1063 [Hepatospora eriocheir]|uniref:Uncharacterized protein n=1 Tax=Hepatospora eriocheir TaxID=1081669 RepID=A0A1X0Q777_9MICR|nr:hypothetical protein HERIO_2360 [Hepatospora eriocheir]ORD99306.1 hypothetical protein A0H76_1063 [Hepatospora eriocheir]
MNEVLLTILMGTLNFVLLNLGVFGLSHMHRYKKNIKEIQLIGLGTLTFMYVSWIIVYLAQINPFIEPEMIIE